MSVFSKRFRRALDSGQLQVEFDLRARTRISRLLDRYNASIGVQHDPNDSWVTSSDIVTEVHGELLDVYGQSELPGSRDVSKFLAQGPAHGVLDAIELFLSYLSDEQRSAFVSALNDLLSEEDSPWRLLGGEMVLLNSVFVHEQVVARSYELSADHGFHGVTDEMRRAQNDLADGDSRGAIHNAGSSFESAMQAALGVDRGTAGELVAQLKADGYFIGLPADFIDGFATNVLMSLPWMRNRLGGHGQGRSPVTVPAPYARLALSLSGALNQFVIELMMEREGETPRAASEESASSFMPAGASSSADDDIPF